MKPEFVSLVDLLYAALVAYPCRCEYERNGKGVPLWTKSESGELTRKLIKQCSRCVAIFEYENQQK